MKTLIFSISSVTSGAEFVSLVTDKIVTLLVLIQPLK